MRERLPNRRASETIKLTYGPSRLKFYATLGYYPDGRLGEVFTNSAKAGSETATAMRDASILLSMALQHHVRVEDIRAAMTRDVEGMPEGAMGALLDAIAVS